MATSGPADLYKLIDYYTQCIEAENTGRGTINLADAIVLPDLDQPPTGPVTLPDNAHTRRFIQAQRRSGTRASVHVAWPVVGAGEQATPVFVFDAEVDLDAAIATCDTASVTLSPAGLQQLGLDRGEVESALEAFDGLAAADTDALESFLDDHVDPAGAATTFDHSCVLFAGNDTSAITYFLVQDLNRLRDMALPTDNALGFLLRTESAPPITWDPTLVAPLATNLSQEHVTQHALSRPITVVTGPPGTGKSQVLVNTALAAVERGERVLLASKNNHAIDVVLDRLRSVDPAVVVPRIGAKSTRGESARQLLAALDRAESDPPPVDQTLRDLVNARVDDVLQALAERDRLDQAQTELAAQIAQAEDLVDPLLAGWAPRDDEFDFVVGAAETARHTAVAHEHESSKRRWPRFRGVRRRARTQAAADSALDKLLALLGPPLNATARSLREDDPAGFLTSVESLVRRERLRRDGDELDLLRRSLATDDELRTQLDTIADDRQRLSKARIASSFIERRRPLTPRARGARGFAERLATVASTGSGAKALPGLFAGALDAFPLWVCTSMSAGSQMPLQAGLFDLAIIDEAGQSDIPSALPLLARAKRAMVVGDPRQLAHIATLTDKNDDKIVQRVGLDDDTAALWNYRATSLYGLADGHRSTSPILLREHYRSHPDIIGISNRMFYGERLDIRRAAGEVGLEPTGWVDVTGTCVHGPGGRSRQNPEEAEEAIRQARALVAAGLSTGIVTPYRAQVELIRTMLGTADTSIAVDTAHGFQGDERDAIVLSTVLSGPDHWWGHAGNPNLVNVSITRARDVLRIVGDRDAAKRSETVLAEIASHL